MPLSLNMLRCPASVRPQSRTVEGGEFAIGRGPGNDWVLPDPERFLSKRHCVLACHSGGWKVIDHSTNGTYVNRERAPIGRGHVHPLKDGDRLHMGTYEIEIRMIDDTMVTHHRGSRAAHAPEPVTQGAMATTRTGLDNSLPTRTGLESTTGTRPMTEMKLPVDYDPLAPDPTIDGGLTGAAQRVTLPEDWDLDTDLSNAVHAAAIAKHAPAPDLNHNLLAAFLQGAGLNEVLPADSVAAMEALGAIFRQMIYGLRQVMIARARLKAKFRIEQTGIRSHGNNPLKFSASDDDALATLVGSARHGDKDAIDAVADALNDIRLHELATVSAMQAAVADLLAQLEPAKFWESGDTGFNLVPAQRKARAWDAFEAQHDRLRKSLADGLDSAFGKAFARAYELALADITAKES
ncbi:MAG: type VI secretion system-associated FHA domain protein TagH [Alphaproteobacteria bacterium]|nr:type VI secretion system-associated FHA domain protein TagH [Alphaproteobacteria bacterium]